MTGKLLRSALMRRTLIYGGQDWEEANSAKVSQENISDEGHEAQKAISNSGHELK